MKKRVKNGKKYNAIALYSGAGGLDKGLENAGFDIRVALDFDHDSCETLQLNFPGSAIIEGDVTKVPTDEIRALGNLEDEDIDLLAGGPPCQPFSKSAFWNGSKGFNDPRAVTLHEYIRILCDTKPKAFLLENVFGLAYKNNKEGMDFMLSEFDRLGYHTTIKVVNMAQYGVPQIRQRLIIIGMRKDFPAFVFPEHTHASPEIKKQTIFDIGKPTFVTAKEAFEGLKNAWKEVPKELVVGGKWGHLLAEIPPGDNYLHYTEKKGHANPLFDWRSRYWTFLLKLSPDKPSWTIQAQPGPYVGPFHWEGRRLTLEEKKRIQTFPDDFKFYGNRTSVQKQIGNAVPVKMGEVLGKAIIQHLKNSAPVTRWAQQIDLDEVPLPKSRKILAA